jgi:hypothetical protein
LADDAHYIVVENLRKPLFAKIIEFLFVILMGVNLKVKIFNISNIHKPLAGQVISED